MTPYDYSNVDIRHDDNDRDKHEVRKKKPISEIYIKFVKVNAGFLILTTALTSWHRVLGFYLWQLFIATNIVLLVVSAICLFKDTDNGSIYGWTIVGALVIPTIALILSFYPRM